MSDRLSPIEAHILKQLGGRRWTTKRYTPTNVADATMRWKAVRSAVGFTTSGGWMTTDKTSPKLVKSGVPSLGITIHSAQSAKTAWMSVGVETQQALAAALDTPHDELSWLVTRSVCPMATKGCICGCVTGQSPNALLPRSQVARLARHLFLLAQPAEAFALTGRHLEKARDRYGRRGARWRVNVSDDLRIERLAPGLFSLAPRPYSYTKWTPEQRPGRPDFRVVYSGSERTSDQQVIDWCAAGHRVALVLDVAKSKPLPATWNGVPVVDGDKTDDLWKHPEGVIVGLRAKGRLNVRAQMRELGFTKPAEPCSTQLLALPTRRKLLLPASAA